MWINAVYQKARVFLCANSGATAIEYGLIMALMFLAIVGGVAALGDGVKNTLYDKIANIL